jgi:hypothetical protein
VARTLKSGITPRNQWRLRRSPPPADRDSSGNIEPATLRRRSRDD